MNPVHTSGQQAPFRTFVITVSDSCAQGARNDLSGPAVTALLLAGSPSNSSIHSAIGTFTITGSRIIPDEQPMIEEALREAARQNQLVITTGGTGLTTRDVTPEATRAVCARLLDGLSEQMRTEGLKETPFAVLSRGVCGLLDGTLVINLPGSPRGAVTSLGAILPVLPHALRLLLDPRTPHPEEAASRPAGSPGEQSR